MINLDQAAQNAGIKPLQGTNGNNLDWMAEHAGVKPILAPQEQQKPTEEHGIFSRIGTDLKNRVSSVGRTISDTAEGKINPVSTGIQTAGAVAGGINDIVGEGVHSALGLVPDFIKTGAKSVVKSALGGQGGVNELKGMIGKGTDAYKAWAEKHPEASKDLESVANIAQLMPEGKVAELGAKEVKPIVTDIGKGLAERSIGNLDKQVEGKFVKAIRPSISSMPTEAAGRGYLDKAKTAVNAIVENSPNLHLVNNAEEKVVVPETLQHFSQAIDQTKKDIFKQYSAKAAQAGEQGVMVDLHGAAGELSKMADNVVLQDKDPGLIGYINEKANLLAKRGAYTPEQAQDAIKMYNDSLEAFYKNPGYDTASKAAVDAVVANNLRSSLDSAVESISGPGYQDLKNTYGALKTVEKDVSRRALVDARKNAKGLLDFTDIATGAGAVDAILGMHPAQMAAAATAKAIKTVFKRMNDPNEIVRSLFSGVKSAKEKALKYGITGTGSKFVK